MGLQTFVDKGGFKLLAVSRLSSGAYALVCYLVNCLAAGVDEVVSSVGELSVLIGIPDRLTKQALEELETAVKIDPTFEQAHILLSRTYLKLKNM